MSYNSRGKYSAAPQVLSSLAIACGSLNVGGWMSFSAVAIPKMIREAQASNSSSNSTADGDVVLQVDLAVGSWIGLYLVLGLVCILFLDWSESCSPQTIQPSLSLS